MRVSEIAPHRLKKAFLGHKGYLMTIPGWILVFRHFLFLTGHPFHHSRVEIVWASRRDTKISVWVQVPHRLARGVAKIGLAQQMKNSVGEEGANFLSSSAPENRAHVAGVKAGASNQWNTAFLPLLISIAREGNSFSRYVNADDVETQLKKIERISTISASPIDDFYAFRSPEIAVQKCLSQCSGSRAW